MMPEYHKIPWVEILGGLTASVIFLVDVYVAQFTMLSAAGFGAETLLAWRLLFGTDLSVRDMYAGAKGISSTDAADLMARSKGAICRIVMVKMAIPEDEFKSDLRDIASMSSEILNILHKHPERIVSCSRFLSIYIVGVADVGEHFLELRPNDPERIHRVDDLRRFLARAKETCVSQRRALIRDQVLELDMEVDVLSRRMKAEPTYEEVRNVRSS